MKEIEKYIESYFGIGDKDLSAIGRLFEDRTLKKNDFLLKESQYAKSLSFIRSGYLRVFAMNTEGTKEITQWISMEGLFITDLSSFIFETPSRWNIQALSDCELYTISLENYQKIGSVVKTWDKLEKHFIAKCFVTLENRVFSLLSMSAEQRVKELFMFSPEIFNMVPLNYIASMLGITPETLSRVRKKMSS